MRQVALYTRVSTDRQTTQNQEMELRAIAKRAGWEVVKVYCDEGISGAKGREERPAFDALCKDATRREFDMVMAWSVDRLGRSLQNLIDFLSEPAAFCTSSSWAPFSRAVVMKVARVEALPAPPFRKDVVPPRRSRRSACATAAAGTTRAGVSAAYG
jgi:hypothetical protein